MTKAERITTEKLQSGITELPARILCSVSEVAEGSQPVQRCDSGKHTNRIKARIPSKRKVCSPWEYSSADLLQVASESNDHFIRQRRNHD
jgi:hypothetical protein